MTKVGISKEKEKQKESVYFISTLLEVLLIIFFPEYQLNILDCYKSSSILSLVSCMLSPNNLVILALSYTRSGYMRLDIHVHLHVARSNSMY